MTPLASRLALIVVTDPDVPAGLTLVDVVRAALRGGAPAIQLRAKDAPARTTGVAFVAWMPPMPTIGMRTAAATSAIRAVPMGAPASALLAVPYTGPTPR